MAVGWAWNQEAAERELDRLIRTSLGPVVDSRVASVRCPDHPSQRFTTRREGDELLLIGCCRKGIHLAAQAAGLHLEWTP
jgi:hypothetical protein